MIEIRDGFLTKEEFDYTIRYCENDATYTYGEPDNFDLPPTGMVHEIMPGSIIYKLFESKTKNLVSDIELYRMYINCFAPTENPYFHTDGDPGDITFLYYPTRQWQLDDGGETQFLVDNEIYGVTPIPNRLVYFDASIRHRATTFRNKHRFTVAIKYGV